MTTSIRFRIQFLV